MLSWLQQEPQKNNRVCSIAELIGESADVVHLSDGVAPPVEFVDWVLRLRTTHCFVFLQNMSWIKDLKSLCFYQNAVDWINKINHSVAVMDDEKKLISIHMFTDSYSKRQCLMSLYPDIVVDDDLNFLADLPFAHSTSKHVLFKQLSLKVRDRSGSSVSNSDEDGSSDENVQSESSSISGKRGIKRRRAIDVHLVEQQSVEQQNPPKCCLKRLSV